MSDLIKNTHFNKCILSQEVVLNLRKRVLQDRHHISPEHAAWLSENAYGGLRDDR